MEDWAELTGTAALLRASGVAVVKVLGVVYLLCMAWAVSQYLPPRSARQIVTSAVLGNLLNPELTIFFAFLPQFVPADAGQPVRRCWRSAPFSW